MFVSASIKNAQGKNEISIATDSNYKSVDIPAKTGGKGSSVNGAELLFLSLATCFCNDVYREAAKRNMNISSVEVEVNGEFGKEGEPGFNIKYNVKIQSSHTQEQINDLIRYVDSIAEIHKTIRNGTSVTLNHT